MKNVPSARVAVVIPSFNRRAITEATVQALAEDGYDPKTIFICDSGSTDGTREAVSRYPGVEVLNVGSDQWWSGAVNAGVRTALARAFEYVLVLNDDIIFQPRLIASLVEQAQQHGRAIICAAQRDVQGRLFYGNRVVGWRRRRKLVEITGREPAEIHVMNGCCQLIPIEVFRQIGLFNVAQCPHLAGDIEFQLRASRAGYRLFVCPAIVIDQSAPTDLRSRYRLRTLLTAPNSPYRPGIHWAVGKQIYGSHWKLALMGAEYHLRYALGVIKAAAIAVFRNRKW